MGGADESSRTGLAPGPVARRVHQGQVRRHTGSGRTLDLGNPGSQRGPAPDRRLLLMSPPGHALVPIVASLGSDDGADDRKLVGHLRQARKELADFHAGNVRLDRAEFTSHLARRVRLEIPEVDVRGTAGKVDVDDRLVRAPGTGQRLHLEELRQRESPKRHSTRLQEPAPRDSIAMAALPRIGSAQDCQHGLRSPATRFERLCSEYSQVRTSFSLRGPIYPDLPHISKTRCRETSRWTDDEPARSATKPHESWKKRVK